MLENKLAYDLALCYAQTMLAAEIRDGNVQVSECVPDGWRELERLQELFNEAYEHYAYLNEVELPTYPDKFVPGGFK